MKKYLALIFVLLASVSSAQLAGNGVVGLAGPVVQVITSGSAVLWDDQFSASTLATDTWSVTRNIGASNVIQNGDGSLYLYGGGPADIYTSTFQPQGVSRGIYGDFTCIAKMSFVPTQNYQQAGLMCCDFTTKNSTIIGTFYSSDAGGQRVSRKDIVGGSAYITHEANTMDPIYLKISKSGTAFTTYYSSDGSTWTTIDDSTKWGPPASDSVQLWAYNIHTHTGGTAVATATFDYITITRP